MDDEVSGSQVGKGLQRPPADAPLAGRPLPEDLRVGQQDEPEIAPDESAPCRRDREQELCFARQDFPCFEDARIGAAEQVLLPQGLAEVRKRDDDALPRAHERVELVLGLREAACNERRALRLEGELLPGRKSVEECGSLERDRVEPLLGPDCAHLVGEPHEVRPRRYGRHEVVRDLSGGLSL